MPERIKNTFTKGGQPGHQGVVSMATVLVVKALAGGVAGTAVAVFVADNPVEVTGVIGFVLLWLGRSIRNQLEGLQ